MSLSDLKSALLKKGDHAGFAHIACATADELRQCIIETAGREKEYYDDLMKIAPDFKEEAVRQFEEKYGTFDEITDYTPSDSAILLSALLHELDKKKSRKM